jgi:hypothetical protein
VDSALAVSQVLLPNIRLGWRGFLEGKHYSLFGAFVCQEFLKSFASAAPDFVTYLFKIRFSHFFFSKRLLNGSNLFEDFYLWKLFRPLCQFMCWNHATDKLQLTGQNLGRVFNFRFDHLRAEHFWCCQVKLPNLNSKTQPKQLLGSLPLVIALPDNAYKMIVNGYFNKLVYFWVRFVCSCAHLAVFVSKWVNGEA